MPPNFSIIIPTKNEEQNIGNCLDSIFSVSWDKGDFEIILIDNGSTDRTIEIVRAFDVTYFVRPNDTLGGLRNFGAWKSNGKILAFLDADCTVHSSWLREASRYLADKEVACFGSPPIVPPGSTWVQRTWFQVRQKRNPGETEWLESMNMFVRRDAFISVGGFDEELITCEDYDISLRLKRVGKLMVEPRIVAIHHGEAATVTDFYRKEIWRGTGNFHGMSRHGISLRELPSVALPLFYLILGTIVVLFPVAWYVVSGRLNSLLWLISFAIWQAPLAALALWKIRSNLRLSQGFQLYTLLNIYFLARGNALLAGLRH